MWVDVTESKRFPKLAPANSRSFHLNPDWAEPVSLFAFFLVLSLWLDTNCFHSILYAMQVDMQPRNCAGVTLLVHELVQDKEC